MTGASWPLRAELDGLQDLALIVDGRETAERLMRVVRALETLCEVHAADSRGRCLCCRPARRFWRRCHPCTVQDAFTVHGLGPLARPGNGR
jgi:hypothetical protein